MTLLSCPILCYINKKKYVQNKNQEWKKEEREREREFQRKKNRIILTREKVECQWNERGTQTREKEKVAFY